MINKWSPCLLLVKCKPAASSVSSSVVFFAASYLLGAGCLWQLVFWKDPEWHLASHGLGLLVLSYEDISFLLWSHINSCVIRMDSDALRKWEAVHWSVCIDSPCCPSSTCMRDESIAFKVPWGSRGQKEEQNGGTALTDLWTKTKFRKSLEVTVGEPVKKGAQRKMLMIMTMTVVTDI